MLRGKIWRRVLVFLCVAAVLGVLGVAAGWSLQLIRPLNFIVLALYMNCEECTNLDMYSIEHSGKLTKVADCSRKVVWIELQGPQFHLARDCQRAYWGYYKWSEAENYLLTWTNSAGQFQQRILSRDELDVPRNALLRWWSGGTISIVLP